MLSVGKILKKIHICFFGPLARLTGPKHGKNENIFDFDETYYPKVSKHAECGKNTKKIRSLFLRSIGPLDGAKTWKKRKNL